MEQFNYYTYETSVYNVILATVFAIGIVVFSLLLAGLIWRAIKIKYGIRTSIYITLKHNTDSFRMQYSRYYFAVDGLTDWYITIAKKVRIGRLDLKVIPKWDTVSIINNGVIGNETTAI